MAIIRQNVTIDSYDSAVVNLAAGTADQELVGAPGADKQIWVYGLALAADTGGGTIVLQDEDDSALTGTISMADGDRFILPVPGDLGTPWIKVTTNKALEADTGSACTVDGLITYAVVSV